MMVVKQYTKDGSIYRPDIIWKAVVIKCIICFSITTVLSIVTYYFIKKYSLEQTADSFLQFVDYIYFIHFDSILLRLFMLILTIIMMIRLKHLLIFTVYLYQKFAPESVRSSCIFKPSCSQYMIMSIEKYGAIFGTIKGLERLSRCHAPNGGYDYP